FFFLLVRFLRQVALADILTVADTEHHHNEIRLLLSEDVARNMPPIEIALRLVSQQSRVQFVCADNGTFRRIREGVFQSVGKPVGHGVAHDDNRGRRRNGIRLCFRLFRRRRSRVVDRRLLLGALVELPLASTEKSAAEKSATTRSLWTLSVP